MHKALILRLQKQTCSAHAWSAMCAWLDTQHAALPRIIPYSMIVLLNCVRTVRSEASGVLGAMAKTVGKGLAPFLKALAGSWWLAQFDLHSEAAAAARDAFQAAFAGPKQKEALLFTRTEVSQSPAVSLAPTLSSHDANLLSPMYLACRACTNAQHHAQKSAAFLECSIDWTHKGLHVVCVQKYHSRV